MLKKMIRRAMAEAMHGRGYGSGKPWKKGGYDRDFRGYDDRYERGYRHDGWYRSDRYGYGRGYRGGGLKSMLISALMSWLSRRR